MKKGFTLVELLVSIVVIVLLTLLVIPGIQKLQSNNQKSLYQSYEKIVYEYGEAEQTLGLVDICNIEHLKYVKDDCNGYVLEENGKRHAYISCGDNYQTDGYNNAYACTSCDSCQSRESLGKIDVTATAGGEVYQVNRPYGEIKYVNTEDIQLTFRVSEKIDRFAYYNAANNTQLGLCDEIQKTGDIYTCNISINKTGMYFVKAYVNGKLSNYKAYFNIKIDKEPPTFSFANNTTTFDMNTDEWDNYELYPYTNQIIDLNDNIGVKSLTYKIDTGIEKSILVDNHNISENLFGTHSLTVVATDDAGNNTTKSLNLNFIRNKKNDVITITKFNITYDGNNHSASGSAKSGLSLSFVYYSDSSCNNIVSSIKDAKTYYARVTTTGNYAYNAYSGCHEVGTINKKVANLSLSETSGTLTYETNKNVTITKDGDGLLSCSSSNNSIATCTISGNTLTIVPKANSSDNQDATITVTSSATTNYLEKSVTFEATVNRKLLVCPDSPSEKTYTGSNQESGITCPNESSSSGTTSATNGGTYYHNCNANTGYKFAITCSVPWVINQPVSVTCSITTTPESNTSKELVINTNVGVDYLVDNPYSWTSETSGFGTQSTKIVTAAGTYTAYVKDKMGNTANCSITLGSRKEYRKSVCTGSRSYTNWGNDSYVIDTGCTPSSTNYKQIMCETAYQVQLVETRPSENATTVYGPSWHLNEADAKAHCNSFKSTCNGGAVCTCNFRTANYKKHTQTRDCTCSPFGDWSEWQTESISTSCSIKVQTRNALYVTN